MAKDGFLLQLKALLWRNLLLKKRNKWRTFQEFIFPIYFVGVLAATRLSIQPSKMDPISSFPVNSLERPGFKPSPGSALYVSPNTTNVSALMPVIVDLVGLNPPGFVLFESAEDAEDAYRDAANQSTSAIAGGINFNDGTLKNTSYTIRMNSDDVPSTTETFSSPGQCRSKSNGLANGNCDVNDYMWSGFLQLQSAIDTAFLRLKTGDDDYQPQKLNVQMMPKGSFTTNYDTLQLLSALYLVIAFSPYVGVLVAFIVYEKEKKIKEGMRMMGMRDSAFWFSWGILYAFIIGVTSILTAVLLRVTTLLPNSDIFLLFLILFEYGLSIITFSFMLTPFFSKAEVAGTMAGLASIVFSLLFIMVNELQDGLGPDGPISSIPAWGQTLMSFLSPTAFALAINQAVFLDIDRGGLTFDTVGIGQFPVSTCMIMLAIDTVLYGLLAFYFDNVIPNEFGLRRPPWFCFMPSYWCSAKIKPRERLELYGDGQYGENEIQNPNIESVPPEMKNKDVLRVLDMHKKFKDKDGKEIKAVNGVSMDMYEGEITALLGHNGAGKTTLINMLTGMISPTSGAATIYDQNVTDSDDMTRIRMMTGVCHQQNILFDDLTVKEHLRFVGMIKGVTGPPLDGQVEQAVRDVALTDQGDTLAKQLSGGQKRKLCVAMALICDPKVIFLDEPTAGIDAFSRRHLWSLLKERKKDKLILLTTHFMDEADILADRKIIISKGKVKCCGTSLFLKNKFGIGYHLSMNMNENADLGKVTEVVEEHVEGAQLGRQHGKEVTYTLPLNSVDKFVDLFGDLEKSDQDKSKSESLGIESYGISMTTLEEVFLKLEEEEAVNDASEENGGTDEQALISREMDEANFTPSDSNSSRTEHITWQRFKALVKIRFVETMRNKIRFFFQIVFPVIFVIIGVVIGGNLGGLEAQSNPSLLLSPSLYALVPNSPSSNPKMAYINSTGGSVDAFVGQMKSLVSLSMIDDYSALQTDPPHNLGLDILDVNGTTVISSNLTMIYNSTAAHCLPVILNVISNTLAKLSGVAGLSIEVFSKPWPNLNPSELAASGSAFTGGIFIGMAAALIPAGFGVQVVKDRISKARSQLRISGVTMNLYWGSLFCAHFVQYFAAVTICICVVLAFQPASLFIPGAILALVLVFLFFMPLLLVFVYLLSFLFNKFETAQGVFPLILTWLALIPYGLVFGMDVGGLHDVAGALHCIFCLIVPPYAAYGGVYFIQRVYLVQATIQSTSEPDIPVSEYFEWDSYIPATLIFPFIDAVWMYFLLRFLEVKKYGGDWRDIFLFGDGFKIKESPRLISDAANEAIVNEDEDVKEERKKAAQDDAVQSSVVLARDLCKEFIKGEGGCGKKKEESIKVAVKNNSFIVYPGEVFGLLGPNGAGKSTTLNMVIAEEGPTKGTVFVCGNDVKSSLSSAFQEMGYCPQHDPLWDRLTLQDHLELYATVRGIPKQHRDKLVKYFMVSLKIQEHANKFSTDLSGGTKRKLSYIMSNLGNPRAVLLDEPSTGMDPQSKRFFWFSQNRLADVISCCDHRANLLMDTISSNFGGSQRGAILTTHYMEEAAALCDRVAIMVNGQMQCIGTIQHLKSKYGSGYLLEVKQKLKYSEEEQTELAERLRAYIESNFPGSSQSECFAERAIFRIPQAAVKALAHAFGTMENAKEEYEIVEYSLSQSTLEQVFLEFAKNQEEETVAK